MRLLARQAPLALALLFLAATARAETLPPSMAELAARVMPAVVAIASTDPVSANHDNDDDNGDNGNDDGTSFKKSAGNADDTGTVLPPPKANEALGAGFVIDPRGYIVTNNHVISGAANVAVTFQDGTILPATLVGRDKEADIAVLKVAADEPLAYVKFGDSSSLRVGDWVLAIGNPFGLSGSSSAGIVSALDRNIHQGKYDDFIQTDAAINPGNSGGPMFNMQGDVVGMNSAIYSPSDGSIGLGFAIPASMVQPVAHALITAGTMTRGWLGVATESVTPPIKQTLALPGTNGALIGAVAPGSPAAAALKPGDVITTLSGTPIKNPRALNIRTAEIPAGQHAAITFYRDGTAHQATLLIAKPPTTPDDTITPPTPAAPKNVSFPSLGLVVSAKPVDGGVKIAAVTGPAAQAGIAAGDLIQQVTGQNIATVADLQTQLKQLEQNHAPAAILLISGATPDGTNPGPRWIPVPFKP